MLQLVSLIFICLIVIYPGDSTLRWINLYLVDGATGFPSLIQWNWTEIHPVDSTIRRLNKWGSDNLFTSGFHLAICTNLNPDPRRFANP